MTNGWFAFAVVASTVLCAGVILAAVIMRAAWAQRERESLSVSDLRAVEESAILLIEQLRSEADRAVSEADSRLATLREALAELDKKLEGPKARRLIRKLSASECGKETKHTLQSTPRPISPGRQQILELASSGMDSANIAKATGLDCAEVNLALRIANLPARASPLHSR